jgi:hypothetical protein
MMKGSYPVKAGVTLGQLARVTTLLNREATWAIGPLKILESVDRYSGSTGNKL